MDDNVSYDNLTILVGKQSNDTDLVYFTPKKVGLTRVSDGSHIASKLIELGFTVGAGSSQLYSDGNSLYVLSPYDAVNRHVFTSRTPKRVLAECVLLRPDAIPPVRKRMTDACYDIVSNVDVTIPPRGNVDISTGFSITVPRGWYFTVEGRSGLGARYRIVPFTGTIDACYIGELFVMLTNNTDASYDIKKGDRIAQLAVKEQIDMEIIIVDAASAEYSHRGQEGFGSSGK